MLVKIEHQGETVILGQGKGWDAIEASRAMRELTISVYDPEPHRITLNPEETLQWERGGDGRGQLVSRALRLASLKQRPVKLLSYDGWELYKTP